MLTCQNLPPEVGLLQPVLRLLSDWCEVLSAFPVVTWSSFVDYIRSRVNLLATEEHIRELTHQLVVIGEVSSCAAFSNNKCPKAFGKRPHRLPVVHVPQKCPFLGDLDPSNTWFLESEPTNGISIGSAVFTQHIRVAIQTDRHTDHAT